MKRKLTSYFAGVLTAVVLGTLTVSAFAAGGLLTLTVSPIRVMVNGEEFHPRDAQGNEVYIFQSQGTTYVPLRALSEAYGLEVGYDARRNMASVSGSVQAQAGNENDFLSVWTVKEKPVTGYGTERIFTATYSGPLGMQDLRTVSPLIPSTFPTSSSLRKLAELFGAFSVRSFRGLPAVRLMASSRIL